MANVLGDRVEKERFTDASEEALVSLLVAGGHVRQALNDVCATYGITHDQYNVLRILRGVHPDGHPRKEVTRRLMERSPDVTRLLDRLVREGYVERYRSEEDRRLSIARITGEGLNLLDEMEDDILGVHERFFGDMSGAAQKALARLCAMVYEQA